MDWVRLQVQHYPLQKGEEVQKQENSNMKNTESTLLDASCAVWSAALIPGRFSVNNLLGLEILLSLASSKHSYHDF